jgi:hypothetical protein
MLLGRLMNEARGFLYVGSDGFLLESIDCRRFEFAFLKKHGRAIVCYWCGSDIRSPRLMHELERATGLPNVSTYAGYAAPSLETEEWERHQKETAAVADAYADAMFTLRIDHLSHLTGPTEPFRYFLPEKDFAPLEKYGDLSRIKVVHATTSPLTKGTPLVRAAVAGLRAAGYEFEYVELMGVPNSVVKQHLAEAHIALNHFYGFAPTVCGVEALAAGCVVLMSSDETIEPDLPRGSNEAWVVTRHHEVLDNLKRLLDHPERLEPIARRGQAWARQYASSVGAGPALLATLREVLDGTYLPSAGRPSGSTGCGSASPTELDQGHASTSAA